MIIDKNIECQEKEEVHLMNVISKILDLTSEEKIRVINLLSTDLNLKPLKTIAAEQNKSYNGLKNFGNPVLLCGKYFGVSAIKENNLPF